MNEKEATSFNAAPLRIEDIVRNRISDEFDLTEVQLERFALWLDAELCVLEESFEAFVTPNSLRKSFGR